MSITRFDDRCDVDFLEKSRGIIQEKHYSDECEPIDMIGIYEKGSYFDRIRWDVKVFYRKCKCKHYDNYEEIKFPIAVPHEGVDIHDGPDCRYDVEPPLNKNRKVKFYKFILHCKCSRKGKGKESRKMVDLL